MRSSLSFTIPKMVKSIKNPIESIDSTCSAVEIANSSASVTTNHTINYDGAYDWNEYEQVL